MVKNPLANAGAKKDADSIPGSGRSPGGGHGNPLQYSCLENPKDRRVWRVTIYSHKESDMTLHARMIPSWYPRELLVVGKISHICDDRSVVSVAIV